MKLREGEVRLFEDLDFEVKLVRVTEERGWQPAIFLTLVSAEGDAFEIVWALTVADAFFVAAVLKSDAREVAKQENKMAEFEVMEAMAREEIPRLRTPVGCSICAKPVSILDEDGTRYCKRHAEERGIRPKGKIT